MNDHFVRDCGADAKLGCERASPATATPPDVAVKAGPDSSL
jgi:hypothetical protein